MYNAGDLLYVSTSSGQLTNVKPQAPIHLVYAGIVTRVGAGNGSIFTLIQNGYELDELHDVRIVSPVDGQIIVKSGSLWINSNNVNITGSVLGTSSYALSSSYVSGSGVYATNGIITTFTSSYANLTYITASEMYAAGTNIFGDSSLDVHRFIGTVQATGSVIITGSLSVIGPITGTASYSTTSSYSINATSASYSVNATSASYSINATSASFATTASYALNAASSPTVSGITIQDVWMYSGL
jgi:hypothetical protein